MGASQTVVDGDALGVPAERREGVALRGEVLGVGGDARVADQQLGHLAKCVRGLKPFSTSIAESGRLRGTPFASVTMTS